MMIMHRLSATWQLSLVLQLILVLAAGPVFATGDLRFRTTSFDEIRFGEPFAIAWDGIDGDSRLLILVKSALDVKEEFFSLSLGDKTAAPYTTDPGQQEFLWTPEESNFPAELRADPSSKFQFELVEFKGPEVQDTVVMSPDFSIHPRNALTSASPSSTTTPTSSSTNTNSPPTANGELLNTTMKIGIGVGVGLLFLISMTVAGWFYGRFTRRKRNASTNATSMSLEGIPDGQPIAPSPAPAINPLPELPTNGIAPNDYTDRRWRPYSVPPNFNPQGAVYGPDAAGAPQAFMPPRATTMPSIDAVSGREDRPMTAGLDRAPYPQIPSSLVPGGLHNRPASWLGHQGERVLPYPV